MNDMDRTTLHLERHVISRPGTITGCCSGMGEGCSNSGILDSAASANENFESLKGS